MPSKDLAAVLRARDPEKYASIIRRAELNGYNDYKFDVIPGHPEFDDCDCPKVKLYNDLAAFPELKDVAIDVMEGKYDDDADAHDVQRMRSDLLADGSPDSLFTALGFKLPTSAERALGKLIQLDN